MVDVRLLFTALALAAAMVLSGLLGRRRWMGVVLLALLSFVWLTVDASWEGARLIVLDSHHALTLADLVGVLGFVVAGWLAVRLRRGVPKRLSGTDRPAQS